MDGFQMTESIVKEEEKNEFLDENFKYQMCPHCERNFFQGKLKYHLKLCKANNPMSKSPLRKTKRSYLTTALEKTESLQTDQFGQSPRSMTSPQIKFKKCEFCKATFPLSMIHKHEQKCTFKPHPIEKEEDTNPQIQINKLKSKTKIDFQFKNYNKDQIKEPSSALPRIRHTKDRKQVQKRYISQDLKQLSKNYTVRIRQQLSCFKKALQVQQIQCPFCSRKFSKQASLRHIPICQKLKNQQVHQIFKKNQLNTKSEIYKLNIPIKKTTLFRNKFKSQLIKQKSQELESKSARIFEMQKISSERQEGNKTTLVTHNKRKINKNPSIRSNNINNNNQKYQKIIKTNRNIIFDKQYQRAQQTSNLNTISKNQLNSHTQNLQKFIEPPTFNSSKNTFEKQQSKELQQKKQASKNPGISKTIPITEIMNMTFSKDINIVSPSNKQKIQPEKNKKSFKKDGNEDEAQFEQQESLEPFNQQKPLTLEISKIQQINLITIVRITNQQQGSHNKQQPIIKNKSSLYNLYDQLEEEENGQLNQFLTFNSNAGQKKVEQKQPKESEFIPKNQQREQKQQQNQPNQQYNQDFQ